MTDISTTPRLALPLLAMAQAQKEVTHNEALILLDALIYATVEDGPIVAPPAEPAEGAPHSRTAGTRGTGARRGS